MQGTSNRVICADTRQYDFDSLIRFKEYTPTISKGNCVATGDAKI